MKDAVPPPQVEFLPELYGADPSQFLQTIRMASATDPQRLMMVGHNPGMHELALALAGSGDARPAARRSPTTCRHRDLRYSTLRSTIGAMWLPPRTAGAVRQPEMLKETCGE